MAPHVQEDWESEYQEVTSSGLENTPYGKSAFKLCSPCSELHRHYRHILSAGPEDVSLFAVKDVMQEDSVSPVFGSFQPAHDHPEPVPWLSIRASTEAGQFTDADH